MTPDDVPGVTAALCTSVPPTFIDYLPRSVHGFSAMFCCNARVLQRS